MNSLSEADIRAAYGLMRLVDKAFLSKEKYVGIAGKTLDSAKRSAMEHHYKFLNHFKMRQSCVDPYKIMSWYGFYLAEHADDSEKVAVLAAIRIMNRMLQKEKYSNRLAEDFLLHLYELAKNDKFEDEFGVGKNGLYAVFTAAAMINEPLTGAGFVIPRVS